MSGTSLDGIDVAVVEIGHRRVETVGFQCTPYSDAVRSAILGADRPKGLSYLNFQLGELYARAVLRAVRRYGPVDLIGCHGQTIYHEGGVHTLQIGEPARAHPWFPTSITCCSAIRSARASRSTSAALPTSPRSPREPRPQMWWRSIPAPATW
jgi:1,6-anhydro-N-acetylmuramate kinase